MTEQPVDCVAFTTAIAEISEGVGDLGVPGDLFDFEFFARIFKDPEPYATCARQLVDDPKTGAPEKAVIALAMQRASLESYLPLLSAARDAFRAERIDLRSYEFFLLPPVEWGTALIPHFRDDRVNALYREYLTFEGPDAVDKSYVRDELLTGKAAQHLQDRP